MSARRQQGSGDYHPEERPASVDPLHDHVFRWRHRHLVCQLEEMRTCRHEIERGAKNGDELQELHDGSSEQSALLRPFYRVAATERFDLDHGAAGGRARIWESLAPGGNQLMDSATGRSGHTARPWRLYGSRAKAKHVRSGTKLPILNVAFTAGLGGKAHIPRTSRNQHS